MPVMNLVQIERRLRELPRNAQTMQYLKRAKDGAVPNLPPYLAAAELVAREKAEERDALSSGAARGPVPSVSEQLSQKADLLSLQAMKKREMDAASANQARTAPMPAPEGAPQPEAQPQGGIDQLPVEFGFDGGGLVAFNGQTGSEVKKKRKDDEDREADILSLLPQGAVEGVGVDYSSPQAQIAAQRAGSALATPGAALLDVATLPYNAVKNVVTHGGASITPFFDQLREREAKAARAEAGLAPPAAGSGRGTMAGRTAADEIVFTPAPGQQRPPAPPGAGQQRPPAAAAPAAPAAPAQPSEEDSLRASLMQQLGLGQGAPGAAAAPAGPTVAKTGADIMEAAKLFGLDKPFGDEERQRIAQMEALQAQRQAGRDRQALRETLLGFSRGYGGAAAASIGAENRAYAEDMAHQKAMYDMINAINKGNRGEAEKKFERLMSLQGDREKEAGATSRAELQAKVQMLEGMRRSGDTRYSVDMHYKAAMQQAALAERRGDKQDKAQADANLRAVMQSLTTEVNRLQTELGKTIRPAEKAAIQRDLAARSAELEDARNQLVKLGGGSAAADKPAASATKGRVVNWSDIPAPK